MKRIHLLHRLFVGLNVGAMLTGLGRNNFSGITLNVILLFLLMLGLRVKFWVDDEAYFEDVENRRLYRDAPFYVGFALAILSWLIWLFAGFYLKDIATSSLLMVATLVPSTFWIVATMVQRGAYDEQVPWLCFNVFYIAGFLLVFSSRLSWNPYSQNPAIFVSIALIVLIVIFCLDLIFTRILEQKRRRQDGQ